MQANRTPVRPKHWTSQRTLPIPDAKTYNRQNVKTNVFTFFLNAHTLSVNARGLPGSFDDERHQFIIAKNVATILL